MCDVQEPRKRRSRRLRIGTAFQAPCSIQHDHYQRNNIVAYDTALLRIDGIDNKITELTTQEKNCGPTDSMQWIMAVLQFNSRERVENAATVSRICLYAQICGQSSSQYQNAFPLAPWSNNTVFHHLKIEITCLSHNLNSSRHCFWPSSKPICYAEDSSARNAPLIIKIHD
jgi:hypothetical protein